MKKLLYLLTTITLLASCSPFNTSQTGRTLGRDNLAISGNLNFIPYDFYKTGPHDSLDYLANLQFSLTGGIREKFDAGLRVNSSLTFGAFGKYQWLGTRRSSFASSVYAEIGVNPMFAEGSGFNLQFSPINSWHPTNQLALVYAPKYVFIFYPNWDELGNDTRYLHLFGHTVGFVVGKKHQISAEVTFAQDMTNSWKMERLPAFTIGYTYNLIQNP